MGCSNSHLRPFFRRCRRRSKNKDDATNCTPKRQANEVLIDNGNHVDPNSSAGGGDLLHGFQFLGSSMANKVTKNAGEAGALLATSTTDQPSCVSLLAMSEISHSQIDFFKMLDEKIQQGPDYDSEEEKVETDRLLKNNLESWRRGAEKPSAWKPTTTSSYNGSNRSKNTKSSNNSNSKLGMSQKSCQWEDDGG